MEPPRDATLIKAAVLVVIFIGSIVAYSQTHPRQAPANVPSIVICTQDARQCPDGSYVGRIGPYCDFAACTSTHARPPKADVTVKYTGSGFIPATVVAKRGNTVLFLNNANNAFLPAGIAKGNKPAYPGFTASTPIQPGDSFYMTFSATGTWAYTNTLHNTHTGVVVVK
jgi:plastocyanin